MNYLYSRLEYDANFDTNTPERKAFRKHLQLVANALHDIEWVDSGDCGPGDENAAIRACLGSGAVLDAAVAQAHEALEALDAAVAQAHEALEALRAELERARGQG
jgi:hypothetical protein